MHAAVAKEFEFRQSDFERIKKQIFDMTGISLSDAKKDMVYGRLSRRIRDLGLTDFKDYCDLVAEPDSDELNNFINAITTNLTSFFREDHHFKFLVETALPDVMKKNRESRKIRIWSAGCSTGEEPYSLGIVLKEALPRKHNWDIKILATDLDTDVLAKAQRGIYDLDRINGLAESRQKKWFSRGTGKQAGFVKVTDEIKNLISFKQLNLMSEWPMKGSFDIIFCRNVVIYFDKPTQRILFQRYAELLSESRYLFVGHSESLYKVSTQFKLIGNTIYQNLEQS
ncbi:Chemotaxis protein methyltransferase CheR [hydrothermal vent metagenome]|uniref:protein-glutamate O-methyltransferase n=1 Tax=hydrothermal vent metagenome TaxID=652676 RepID=A0A3B0ZVY1_9ZZZZ